MKVKALTIMTLALALFVGACGKRDSGSTVNTSNAAAAATATPMPVATAAADDTKLTGMITENLKKAGCTGANVAVVAGTVTVMGEVPSAKYRDCVQVVQQSGITGIKNELKQGK
jgi:hypothetical protein